ncbi:MAG: Archaea-specific enzyme related to ProFAR isomerase (HisA) and containing an additional [Candidatus Saccharibacteria bacterium]|nr:Archaea-specific enzyme related to ProFAR isomerase (HisA) and containing an additional [Candidatus Saccharibacteria bacterium]
MTTATLWESGRESHLLDEIIAGRKTIEGRLNRGKFALYKPGDQIWLRRDHRDENGELQNGEPRQVLVEIVAIRKYSSFLEMVKTEGYERVIPQAMSAEAAAGEYDTYYPAEDQATYGILAIEIRKL